MTTLRPNPRASLLERFGGAARSTEVASSADVMQDRRCQWRFIAALCLIGLAWMAIPYHHTAAVSGWIDNDMLPKAGVWVLLFAVCSIKMRWALLAELNVSSRLLWVAVGGLMLILPWVWPWRSPHAAHYAHLGASALLIYGLGGRCWLRVVLPALAILLLLPGLPPAAHVFVVGKLQRFQDVYVFLFSRTVLSADYIRYHGGIVLPVLPAAPDSGVTAAFGVMRECSGYRSLFGMVLLSLLWCAHPGLSIRGKSLLFAAAVSMAVVFNLLRITITVILLHVGLRQLATGTTHSLFGHVVIGIEMVLLYSLFGYLLRTSGNTSHKPVQSERSVIRHG